MISIRTQPSKSPIEIRRSSIVKGYGVFALKNFKKNEIIEKCPIILLETPIAELNNYIFHSENDNSYVIPLGYGCVYNQNELPNASWEFDKDNQIITFRALKNLYKGDEIFIYSSKAPLSKEIRTRYQLPQKLPSLLARVAFMLMLFFIVKMALFGKDQENFKTPSNPDTNYKKSLSTKLDLPHQKEVHGT